MTRLSVQTLSCLLAVALSGLPAAAGEFGASAPALGTIPAIPVSLVAVPSADLSPVASAWQPAALAGVPQAAAPEAVVAAAPLARLETSAAALRVGPVAQKPEKVLDGLFVNGRGAGESSAAPVAAGGWKTRSLAALAPFVAFVPHALGVAVPAVLTGDIGRGALNLGLAMALGGLIGFEREFHDKSAGLRTNILICMGSALFAMISYHFTHDFHVAAQIVTGIGFLGGGAIMRDGDRVKGMTTAATIWLVAAIGLALGYNYYSLAVLGTGLAMVVQTVFMRFDRIIADHHENRTYKIHRA